MVQINEYLPFDEALVLQVEISSMCNALCLGCVRTDLNLNEKKTTIKDKLYLTLENFKTLVNHFPKVERVQFIGTIDEPMMHPNIYEMIEFLISKGIVPDVHTNGSVRSTKWWYKLGEMMKGSRSSVAFSIDGLKENHEFYRQNTNFEKIIENAKAFMAGGGTAGWQFLEFSWNVDDIEPCRRMSKDLGFHHFKLRPDRSHASRIGKEKINAIKGDKNPPRVPDGIHGDPLIIVPEQEAGDITCTFREKKAYFISHDSRLWPCCFVANGFFRMGDTLKALEDRIYGNYGEDFNRLDLYTPEEILKSPFYKSDLVESFDSRKIGDGPTDRIFRCAETCSTPCLPLFDQTVELNIQSKEK